MFPNAKPYPHHVVERHIAPNAMSALAGPYRVILLATDVDILDLRHFFERVDFVHARGTPREQACNPCRKDFFEIARLFK